MEKLTVSRRRDGCVVTLWGTAIYLRSGGRPDERDLTLIYLMFAAILARNGQSRPPSMEEKRKYLRTEISEPAYVSSGGSVMSCVVRNISAEGAAIDIENPAFVPARFRLVMANDSSVYECRIAWIRQKRIGLTFITAPEGLYQNDGK